MVQFSFSERIVNAKLVYYGPAQSGKTTNLEEIHRLTDPGRRNELISLNTTQDRTLFFDLLPLRLGTISGYDVRAQVYTVPGQVRYNATRRVVLAGADAVVFVADSGRGHAADNLVSLENMKSNLIFNRIDHRAIPVLFQYNKQDLADRQPPEAMARALNPEGRRSFRAIATAGEGVLATFAAAVEEMLVSIASRHHLRDKGLDPDDIPGLVGEAFSRFLTAGGSPASPPPRMVFSTAPEFSGAGPAGPRPDPAALAEDLLARSIETSSELAETLADVLQEVSRRAAAIVDVVERGDGAALEASRDLIRREAAELESLATRTAVLCGRDPGPRPPQDRGAGPEAPRAEMSPPATIEAVLKEGVEAAGEALHVRGVQVVVDVPDRLEAPLRAHPTLPRVVAALLEGISDASPAATTAVLRGQRGSLRGRDGAGPDYLVIDASHGALFTAADQQRILLGQDRGSMGEASRLVRSANGFLRFDPLPGGGQRTRLLLPL